jgi:hypothetical protein
MPRWILSASPPLLSSKAAKWCARTSPIRNSHVLIQKENYFLHLIDTSDAHGLVLWVRCLFRAAALYASLH